MKTRKVSKRPLQIRELFGQISGRYDLMNRLITFGQDRSWRRHAVRKAELPQGGRLLDVGSGTGAIAREALCRGSALRVTAVDFTPQMTEVGRGKSGGGHVEWCLADALHLPFSDERFDAVASAYLMRNVSDVRRAFAEQVRVVKPGGRVVCLETSPPARTVLWPFVLIHLRIVIPLAGYLVTRNTPAYRYLPDSTEAFMAPEELVSIMKSAGLRDVSYKRFMLGTQVVVVGIRSKELQK